MVHHINSQVGAPQVKWPNMMPMRQEYINNYNARQNMCLYPIFPFNKNYLLTPISRRNHNYPIQLQCQIQIQDLRMVSTLDPDMFLLAPKVI